MKCPRLVAVLASLPFIAAIARPMMIPDQCYLMLCKGIGPAVFYYGECQGYCINSTCLTDEDVDATGAHEYKCICREALPEGGHTDRPPDVFCKAALII
jgi:hypothetical protein